MHPGKNDEAGGVEFIDENGDYVNLGKKSIENG
jgi:hypothetical protein